MATKLAQVVLATAIAYGAGDIASAQADYVNVLGYAPVITYNNQSLAVTGPISATFYFNQVAEDFYLAAGVEVKFFSGKKAYEFATGDDGYGQVSFEPSAINISTTFQGGDIFDGSILEAVPDGNQSFEIGKSYRISDPSNIVSVLNGTTLRDENDMPIGLFVDQQLSFVPYAIGIDTLAAVPLPASAPMFGAALVALGLAGYGMRRTKAAAVA